MDESMALAIIEGVIKLAPIIYPDIANRTDDLRKLVPIVVPIVQDAIDRGQDLNTINWVKLYGRDAAALRAQVDTQHAAGSQEPPR